MNYVVPRADISPGGKWRLRVELRVSAFDQHEANIEVDVRD